MHATKINIHASDDRRSRSADPCSDLAMNAQYIMVAKTSKQQKSAAISTRLAKRTLDSSSRSIAMIDAAKTANAVHDTSSIRCCFAPKITRHTFRESSTKLAASVATKAGMIIADVNRVSAGRVMCHLLQYQQICLFQQTPLSSLGFVVPSLFLERDYLIAFKNESSKSTIPSPVPYEMAVGLGVNPYFSQNLLTIGMVSFLNLSLAKRVIPALGSP